MPDANVIRPQFKDIKYYSHPEQLSYLSKKSGPDVLGYFFAKGIIAPNVLEDEVEKKAIVSQRLEGLVDPMNQEPDEIWRKRLSRIRDYLTDFYFAYNLPYTRLEELVEQAVNENRAGQPGKSDPDL